MFKSGYGKFGYGQNCLLSIFFWNHLILINVGITEMYTSHHPLTLPPPSVGAIPVGATPVGARPRGPARRARPEARTDPVGPGGVRWGPARLAYVLKYDILPKK